MGSYSLYKHTSPSGKVYIGITRQKPELRWNHGKGYCRGEQPVFERAILKYGWDNIKHDIVLSGLSEQRAKEYEVLLIAFYKSLGISYNITNGGDGHFGSFYKKRNPASAETRRKMSESHKGKNSGEKNPMFGRHETATCYRKHSKKHPASKVVYQYDKSGNFIKKWDCISDVQRELGFLVTNITAVCKGKSFTLGGFRWSYSYPYVFSEDEKRRREEKRKKLSEKAKQGFINGTRKRPIGVENPMYGRSRRKTNGGGNATQG